MKDYRHVTVHSADHQIIRFVFPERKLIAENACADEDAHIIQLVRARDLRADLAEELLHTYRP